MVHDEGFNDWPGLIEFPLKLVLSFQKGIGVYARENYTLKSQEILV